MMCRLDDQKPGNMYDYPGDDDAERRKHLKMLKAGSARVPGTSIVSTYLKFRITLGGR